MTAVVEVDAARPETESKVNLVYMPGLDGLRGLWLFPVLFGHAGFVALLPGAWLAVSGFFTLSGFLITSLMLLEHQRTGRIALGRFWVRRFRRLLPAALVTIFLIIVASSIHPFWPQAGLRGDLTSTLFYVVNWRFIAQGHSYATAFTSGPSPVDHFWSLSVEEQYYLLFPLLMIGLFALRKRWARSTALVLLGVWIASGFRAASWYSGGDWSRAYYATDSRLGEMMMGALLALLLANRRVDHWISGRVGKRLAAAAAIACFVGWILLCLSLSLSNPLTYHGGLMFVSFLSAGSIMAVTIDTPLRRLASHRTLCWLGTTSTPSTCCTSPSSSSSAPGACTPTSPGPTATRTSVGPPSCWAPPSPSPSPGSHSATSRAPSDRGTPPRPAVHLRRHRLRPRAPHPHRLRTVPRDRRRQHQPPEHRPERAARAGAAAQAVERLVEPRPGGGRFAGLGGLHWPARVGRGALVLEPRARPTPAAAQHARAPPTISGSKAASRPPARR